METLSSSRDFHENIAQVSSLVRKDLISLRNNVFDQWSNQGARYAPVDYKNLTN